MILFGASGHSKVVLDILISKIGKGTVVIKDIPDFATVVCNPGKRIKISKI